MTVKNNYIYGWEIEGFGTFFEYDLVQNLRISTENLIEVVGATATYVQGLADFPKKISTTCEALDGSTTQSTMQILMDRLDMADVSGSRYGHLALAFFWGTRPRPWGELAAPITAAAVSVSVNLIAGETVPVAGDLIYLAREVMVVSVVAGAGATRTLTVVRGILGTDNEAHELDDVDIYLQNPIKLDRRVTLYEYDPWTDAEAVRWRGVVEGVDLSDETQVLSVTCRDLLGTISKRRVGRDRFEANFQLARMGATSREEWEGRLMIQNFSGDSVVDREPFYPTVAAGFLVGTERSTAEIKAFCVEIDGVPLAIRTYNPELEPGFVSSWRHGALKWGVATEFIGLINVDDSISTMQGSEILVCDADSPLCYFKDDSENPCDHPAIIALNIMTSTGTARWDAGAAHTVGANGSWDWLPGAWGLGIPVDWIDVDAFTNLQNKYPTSTLRARAAYIGGGGIDGSAMDLLASLAQAMGAYLYMTDIAQISIKRLADPGAAGVDHTLDADDIAWMSNEGDEQGMTTQKPVYSIELSCAARGPGGKPGQIIDAQTIGQRWIGRYRFHAVKDKIDSTLIYGDPVSFSLNANEISRIANAFRWRYAYSVDRLPQYRMRLVHGSALVMPGQWIGLTHPYFYDNESLTRGVTAHRCLVLEGDWNIETGGQELVIVDISPVTGADTTTSPAWIVTAATSSTSFTISASGYSAGNDRLFFVTGSTYKIDLWTETGALRSTDGPSYATAFVSGTGVVALNAAWTAGAVVQTPIAGNVVRIATYDNATGWQTLGYTWLGDASMLLGAADDAAARWDV